MKKASAGTLAQTKGTEMTQTSYHTPQEPPMDPLPITRESIVKAYADNCIERARLGIKLAEPPTVDADGARLISGVATLDWLCHTYGFDYVQLWLDALKKSEGLQ